MLADRRREREMGQSGREVGRRGEITVVRRRLAAGRISISERRSTLEGGKYYRGREMGLGRWEQLSFGILGRRAGGWGQLLG